MPFELQDEFAEWVKTIPRDEEIPQIFESDGRAYRVDKLWELANKLPEEEYVVGSPEYRERLKEGWADETTNITPLDLISDPNLHKEHWQRVQQADTSIPVILSPDNFVADGLHRMIKAMHAGEKSIKAKRFKDYKQMEPALVFEKSSSPLPKKGNCFFHAAIMAAENPDLKLIKGTHSKQRSGDTAHFWLEDKDGNIIDPTASQYAKGTYTKDREISLDKNKDYLISHPLFSRLPKAKKSLILKSFEKSSAEFAPGIPFKDISHELPEIKAPEPWEYGIHEHMAQKAGKHYDLRLGDMGTGFAHSWALRNLPGPGEKVLAVKQPTHTIDYIDFEGKIPEGYGAGSVKLHDRDIAEIIRSDPKKIHFNVYKGHGPEEYSLINTDADKWLLLNRTISRQRIPGLPDDRPDYKEKSPDQVDFENDNEVLQAKIDGAHNLIILPKFGFYPKFISHRTGKKSATGIIEHTHKIPSIYGIDIPNRHRDTILRGEIFATDQMGRAINASTLGGLLNSGVWKSRAKQEGAKTPLRTVIFDVVRYKGKDYTGAPYKEKLKILDILSKAIPHFELPPMAFKADEKRKLYEDIRQGKLPVTKEGVVGWHLEEPVSPVKYKFRPDSDVYIRGFFDATPGSKYEGNAVGGFTYSHTPRGPIVGRVGTGLSDELRQKMYQEPEKYLGAVAKVKALDVYPLLGQTDVKGALRAPAFQEWHLDKNDPEFLKTANLAQVAWAVITDCLS